MTILNDSHPCVISKSETMRKPYEGAVEFTTSSGFFAPSGAQNDIFLVSS
jgi:hypothetical protein